MLPKPMLRLGPKDQAKVDRVSSEISALELKRAQERVMAIVRMQAAARRRLARSEIVDMRHEDTRQQWIDYYWDNQREVDALDV